jgi:protein-disulfide isomerase
METQKNSFILPIAILLGFGIIASVIFFSSTNQRANGQPAALNTPGDAQTSMNGAVRTVTEDDFIRGNPNAPLMFVTYMSYDCPSCKSYYFTMQRTIIEQGLDGLVGWTFRPLPPKGDTEIAHSAYCAEELSTQDGFWDYSDIVFDSRDTARPVNRNNLVQYASSTGVSTEAFTECQSSERHKNKITELAAEARASIDETPPYTVLMYNDQQEVLYGAQTYDTILNIIDRVRNSINENEAPEQ